MNFGSFFSGIGGIDLGLERAGMTCAWQVENNPFCIKVLEKHWPTVPKYGDIRLIDSLPPVDLVCAGFPCQPVSLAGKRKGEQDERWLWPKLFEHICHIGPRYILLENTPGLLSKGMSTILSDLSQIRYNAEWLCIPAPKVGAKHRRERIYIISYPNSFRRNGRPGILQTAQETGRFPVKRDIWESESRMDRSTHGIPDRVDRVKALGNSVVPQIIEDIGRLIMQDELQDDD